MLKEKTIEKDDSENTKYQEFLELEGERVDKIYQAQMSAFYKRLNKIYDDNFEGTKPKTRITAYHYYPFLFHELFPTVPMHEIRTVAVAGLFYYEHLLYLDQLIDDQSNEEQKNDVTRKNFEKSILVLKGSFWHENALRLLMSLFPNDSLFWSYLEEYHREFIEAVLIEQKLHVGKISAYNESEMELIAQGKAAVAKASTAALAIKDGNKNLIDLLSDSQNAVAVANQIYDDLKDWKEDYNQQRYSYLLNYTITKNNLQDEISKGYRPPVEEIGQLIFFSGVAGSLLTKANSLFDKAILVLGENACTGWVNHIRTLQKRNNILKKDLNEIENHIIIKHKLYCEANKQSIEKKFKHFTQADIEKSIVKGLSVISEEQKQDFPEAKHFMLFPKAEGFSAESECQWGDVFQRALIIDGLLDAKANGFNVSNNIINQEVSKLIVSKLEVVRGGWSYFPDLPELPPDADDLGQVLQVLIKANYDKSKISDLCDDSLKLLFDENSHNNGSFETWIADPGDNSDRQKTMQSAIHSKWGTGPDNEVMANLLYGLYLYDSVYFNNHIPKGIRYLETQQNKDGSWDSTWYWGKYYGTYVCSRLISCVFAESASIKKVVNFIISSQHQDGGWGEGQSDPLNTAFALMTMHYLGLKSIHRKVLNKGISYLLENQKNNGCWQDVKFIKMSKGETFLSYSSSTISTVFCIKALCLINPICRDNLV